ncbi:MAG: hypothetical protein AB7S37_05245 [Methanobacteriales archaeon]
MRLGILLLPVIKSTLLKKPDRRNIFWKTYFLSIPWNVTSNGTNLNVEKDT